MENEAPPSDAQLKTALKNAVQRIYIEGNLEDLTVKRVRVKVEREYNLRDGFFKSGDWKTRSKVVIEQEAQKCDARASSDKKASPVKPTPTIAAPVPTISPVKKRKIMESIEHDEEEVDVRPRKRQSKSRMVISDDEDVEQTLEPVKQRFIEEVSSQQRPRVGSVDDSVPEITAAKEDNETILEPVDELGDSDLSEVLDEEPKPKKKKRQTTVSKPKAEPKKRTKSAKSADLDPQAEEIKSLQGWLAKCGVRKVWGKYLKPYETPKEKIAHLKQMLMEIGMTGRYSKEKAESIREARELAADLEAVQAGAKAWGKESDDVPGRSGRRRTGRPNISDW